MVVARDPPPKSFLTALRLLRKASSALATVRFRVLIEYPPEALTPGGLFQNCFLLYIAAETYTEIILITTTAAIRIGRAPADSPF